MKIVQILCAATLIFAGCSSTKESNRKTLRVALCKEPPTIDTRKSGDTLSSVLHFLLNCGFTRITENNEVANDLAESIDISDDGLTYIFTLKDTYWSDGSQITAADFEENWKTVLSPDFPAPNVQMFYCIINAKKAKEGSCAIDEVGIKALDSKRLKVSLHTPTPFFLQLTAFCPFFPMKNSSDGKHISSGPFVLEKWDHNNQLLFSANPKYHNHKKVGVDNLELLIVENEGTALKMFEQGELDYVGGCMCALPIDLVGQYIRDKKASIKPLASTARIYFNTTVPPFHNRKIRKAISLALDRDEIIQALAPLPVQPATGVIPPMLKRIGATPPVIEGDAKALFLEGLKEEGLESMPEIDLLYPNNEINNKVVQVAQEQLRKNLGIIIHLDGLDFKHYVQRLIGRDYMMAEGKWVSQFNDPINILSCFENSEDMMNIPSWENSRYQKKLNKSAYVKSPMERLLLLERAEQIISDELPICPLFHSNDYYILSPKVNNVYICSTRPPEWKEQGED